MKRFSWAVAVLVAGLVGISGAVKAADEKPADATKSAPADKPGKKEKAKVVRLTEPWSSIASLSEEQKTKIADLHKKKLDEVKEAEEREETAIMAVLDDKQKAELKAMTEKEATDKKMKKSSDAKPAEKPAK